MSFQKNSCITNISSLCLKTGYLYYNALAYLSYHFHNLLRLSDKYYSQKYPHEQYSNLAVKINLVGTMIIPI